MEISKYVLPFILFLSSLGLAQAQEQKKIDVKDIRIMKFSSSTQPITKGDLFFFMDNPKHDSAIFYYKQENDFLSKKGIDKTEFRIYAENNYNMGVCYLKKENLEKSLKHFNIAEEYSRKISDDDIISNCFLHYAIISKKQGKKDKAIEKLNDAIGLKELKNFALARGEQKISTWEFMSHMKNLSKSYKLMGTLLNETNQYLINKKGYQEIGHDFYTKSIWIELALEDLEKILFLMGKDKK
jgi:tetratricopeptide (TPR) repeat protein